MKTNRNISAALTIFLIFLLVVFSFHYFTLPDKNIIVRIPEKANANEIADILHADKIISNKKIFLALLYLTNSATKLHSGTYSFNTRANTLKIIYDLRRGKVLLIKLTIPEGFRCDQIAELLNQKNIADGKKFLELASKNKLEGYLFPETYFFSEGMSEQAIIDKLTNEFKRRYTPEFQARAKELKMTRQMVITLASIIEKEAKVEKEKQLISSVFSNRLKKRWYLESCATVRYALKKYTGKLYYKDLKVNSPYNTYRVLGLPPGPICNPGETSIKAALYPADTDLLFFVADSNDDGTHEFSRYYKQHLQVQKNLKKKKT